MVAVADGWQGAQAAPDWRQPAVAMPVAGAKRPDDAVSRAPAAWIWGAADGRGYKLTKTFPGGGRRAVLVATADNQMRVSLNGQEIAVSDNWEQPVTVEVGDRLRDGDNELVAEVANDGGPAGFSCRLEIVAADGSRRVVESDASWVATAVGSGEAAVTARVVAAAGAAPWGRVLADGGPPGGGQPFSVPPGFAVERLFVVPRNELGSWVSLAVDGKGRLIAGDQGDKGLVRITPAPVGAEGETIVERFPAPITGAQGLLWAFDSLYVVCNGGTGSGLYRVTDGDGDDLPEKVEKLRVFDGGGEHGPHNVILSPDGTRLFVICGNHTKVPFAVRNLTPPQTRGGIRDTQLRVELGSDGASRLPANWDEDVIIPRLWDANGHAAGILAPGGYVVSTDRDGTQWEVWSGGYRNPYDFAFNADGELFAYDADMEWDFGTPWYRPTRVNHATSGSELGWRSGAAKWPASYDDSLPALVDVGPGSPVGVCFGYGAKFPEAYQRALFICDWTFGTMYAIHLEPDGSTYKGRKEEFVARTPLPLTDVVIGRDGAMYFTVGGRGGQSELYRVTYAGSEPTTLVDGRDARQADQRKRRHDLEACHRQVDDPAAAVALALPALADQDRFIRYAARVALEHQPLECWREAALAGPPRARIEAAIAVARQGEPDDQPAVLAALDAIDPGGLPPSDLLSLV
ncbi:MAG: heme-binding protein, partial [Planctomycetes bacterium]|nr:heme-binding protein [Planctomycetota bacterium]